MQGATPLDPNIMHYRGALGQQARDVCVTATHQTGIWSRPRPAPKQQKIINLSKSEGFFEAQLILNRLTSFVGP